jgi:protein-S-isoprenylcysteine O-methyltransferase Ste14
VKSESTLSTATPPETAGETEKHKLSGPDTLDEQRGPTRATETAASAPTSTHGQRVRQKLSMLVMAVLMFGLILGGWGFGDLSGFFANPVRLAFVASVALIAVIAFISMPDIQSFRKGTETTGGWLTGAFIVVGLGAMFFFPFADRRAWFVIEDDEWRYVGLVLFLAGSTIRLTGAHALGRQFSGLVTIQDHHQLMQTGIYGVVRHPMYLGLLVEMPGFALIFRSRLAILYFILCLLLISLRIQQEEALLRRHFGDDYEAYCRRTRRLIPFVY